MNEGRSATRRLRYLCLLGTAFAALTGCAFPAITLPLMGVDPAPASAEGLAPGHALVVLRLVAEFEDGSPVPMVGARRAGCTYGAAFPFGRTEDPTARPASLQAMVQRASVVIGRGPLSDQWFAAQLAEGRHVVALAIDPGCMEGGPPRPRWTNVTVNVPRGARSVYAGTLRLVCERISGFSTSARPCRIVTPPRDEIDLARQMVGEHFPAHGEPRTVLAAGYPPPLAGLGLPPPSAADITADGRAWAAAIDWSQFARRGRPAPVPAAPAPPAAPASNKEGAREGRKNGSGTAAKDLDLHGLGEPIAAIAVLAVVLPIAAIVAGVHAVERAEAERNWGACAQSLAPTLAPENVVRHLRGVFGQGGGPAQSAWEVTVTRVVLRRCGPAGHYGLEVASRWIGRAGGSVAYDARLVRRVEDAREDERLTASDLGPGEAGIEPPASCRPFAAYCSARGGEVLLQDIVDAVAAARNAILAAQ